MLDKNGKEIFCGDYVRITLANKTSVYAVCGSDGFYYAVQESPEKIVRKQIPRHKIRKDQLEFIG